MRTQVGRRQQSGTSNRGEILRKWMGSTKACGKVVVCGDVKGLNVARIVRGGHKPSEIQSESNIKNQRL